MGLDVNARLEAALERIATLEPDALFITGDFCADEPVEQVYHRLRSRFERFDRPYYIIPGNHDDRAMMRAAYPLMPGVGQEPIHGTVELSGQVFLFLDSSPGVVDDQQLDWLAAAIAEHPQATVVIHHPPIKLGMPFMDSKYPLRDTDRLLDILTRDGQRRRILCGHYHAARTVSYRNLDVLLCPPTSFFIYPGAETFRMQDHPPGFQLLEWADDGSFRQTVYATSDWHQGLQN
ncbi:3',5'-cyclic adenosine monophosphate phosphodiesterase CpdA [Neolewinella maritima]|uniref:3',5'-cyclic adenosine monophosphate phosphodiesterase CpdA n=2 Tax=Neolewinella maritima TaxID=1383882 RepID=A0ABM9AWY3_9BACT|nr:3',5'-cyclic adenosine monophosphate phosphodiesterase CpdA [Neolewinella maritima]